MNHTTLELLLLMSSFLVCLLLVVAGMLRRKACGKPLFPASGFPASWEQVLAGLFFAMYIGASALPLLTPGEEKNAGSVSMLIAAMAAQVLFYLPIIILCIIRLPWKLQMDFLRWGKWVLAALAAILIPSQLMESLGLFHYIAESTGSPLYQNIITLIAKGSTAEKVVLIIAAVIIAPIAEECCFRGILYNILKYWVGCVPGMVASALLFSAVHVALPQAIPLFLFGMVQCMAYEKAKSLWIPMAIHAIFNAISIYFVLLFFS